MGTSPACTGVLAQGAPCRAGMDLPQEINDCFFYRRLVSVGPWLCSICREEKNKPGMGKVTGCLLFLVLSVLLQLRAWGEQSF